MQFVFPLRGSCSICRYIFLKEENSFFFAFFKGDEKRDIMRKGAKFGVVR